MCEQLASHADSPVLETAHLTLVLLCHHVQMNVGRIIKFIFQILY